MGLIKVFATQIKTVEDLAVYGAVQVYSVQVFRCTVYRCIVWGRIVYISKRTTVQVYKCTAQSIRSTAVKRTAEPLYCGWLLRPWTMSWHCMGCFATAGDIRSIHYSTVQPYSGIHVQSCNHTAVQMYSHTTIQL